MLKSHRMLRGEAANQDHIHAIKDIHSLLIWRAGPDGSPLEPCSWSIGPAQKHQDSQGHCDSEGWLDLLHPQDRERVRPLWREALRSGGQFEARYRLRRQDGGYRWSLGRGLPLTDDGGVVREWIGTVVDIEDMVAAENALATSEERLRLALQSSALGIWDLDLVAGRLWCSKMAAAILGHPPDPGGLDEAAA